MRTSPRIWSAAFALVLGIGAALVVPPRLAADEAQDVAAAALFERGKEAFGKRRYDESIRFFRKALDTSEDVIEAAYWRAQAHEKLKETTDALAAYREFLSLCNSKSALGKASKDELALAGKAEKSVEKLAAGERALDALRDGFVDRLLQFAQERRDGDPAVARDALELILKLDSGNADAERLFTELGGSVADAGPEAGPGPGPFDRLKKSEWHDLIARKSLGTKTPTYEGTSMLVDSEGGKIMGPTERIRTGERYVLEMDFRVLKEHQNTWLVGFVLGRGKEEFYAAFVQRGQVVLNRASDSKGPQEDVDYHAMPPIDPGRWHRLGVRVEGRAIVVWFDGDVVCRTEVADAQALAGDIGVFQQRSQVEYRLVRVAVLE